MNVPLLTALTLETPSIFSLSSYSICAHLLPDVMLVPEPDTLLMSWLFSPSGHA